MADDLDRLLAEPALAPPDGFADAVLRRVPHRPARRPPPRWHTAWQWLALIGAGVPAAVELASFLLSVWTASSAG